MDRVELFSRIEGKKLDITSEHMHLSTETPVRISLDGEIQWQNNSISFNWDSIDDIKEIEQDIFSFYESGKEICIVIIP